MPNASVVALNECPSSTDCVVTVAPATAPPLGPTTVPVIVAVTSCPHAAFAPTTNTATAANPIPRPQINFLFIFIPPVGGCRLFRLPPPDLISPTGIVYTCLLQVQVANSYIEQIF